MQPVDSPIPDIHVLSRNLVIPGVGELPINAYLIRAAEPVLVDTGLACDGEEFEEALRTLTDPAEIRWIWLTHDDADHTGNLERMLALAPEARLLVHPLAALRMATWWSVPLHRVTVLRPGQRVHVGDRHLLALRPPVFDNPMSIGLLDQRTGALFTVDAFGAILPEAPQRCADVPEAALVAGMTAWTAFDAPWTHLVDRDRFRAAVDEVVRLAPSVVLSSHLPAAPGTSIAAFAGVLEAVRDAEPFVPPDQQGFEAIVAGLTAAA